MRRVIGGLHDMRDFKEISRQLDNNSIDNWGAAAVVAACAERLMPEFVKHCRGDGRSAVLLEALDYVWQCVRARHVDKDAAQRHLEACERQLPNEEQAAASGFPYAEDAVAVVMYCLRFLVSGDRQDAVWAARRLYEVTDNLVIRSHDIDTNTDEGELLVLGHRIVQEELGRQLRDLNDVKNASGQFTTVADTLRTRAIGEAATLLNS